MSEPCFLTGDPEIRKFTDRKRRKLAQLLKDIVLKDSRDDIWVAPAGWIFDGATIPVLAQPLIGGPLDGDYIRFAALHDHYYNKQSFATRPVTRYEVDLYCCYEGLVADEAEPWRRTLVYRGVRAGAWWTWAKYARRNRRLNGVV